jgi:hypothetical protein
MRPILTSAVIFAFFTAIPVSLHGQAPATEATSETFCRLDARRVRTSTTTGLGLQERETSTRPETPWQVSLDLEHMKVSGTRVKMKTGMIYTHYTFLFSRLTRSDPVQREEIEASVAMADHKVLIGQMRASR